MQREGKTPKQGQTNARTLTYLYEERGSSAVQIILIAYMYTLIINIYTTLSLSLSKSRVDAPFESIMALGYIVINLRCISVINLFTGTLFKKSSHILNVLFTCN